MDRDGTYERQLANLRKDLAEVFLAALADPDTVEIMLNADGTLWQERLGEQIRAIGTMSGSSAEAAMRTIAAYHATITRDNPVFAVRKRASRVFTLQQYVEAGIMTAEQKRTLVVAVRDHRNILVTEGTRSAGPAHELEHRPRRWNRNASRKQCRGCPNATFYSCQYAQIRGRRSPQQLDKHHCDQEAAVCL